MNDATFFKRLENYLEIVDTHTNYFISYQLHKQGTIYEFAFTKEVNVIIAGVQFPIMSLNWGEVIELELQDLFAVIESGILE
jgi:hypothetical protein